LRNLLKLPKEQATHVRFEQPIEDKRIAMAESSRKRKRNPPAISRRLGRVLGHNTRAAGLFQVEVRTDEPGRAHVRSSKGR
jgi:hypothetical protein